MRSRTASSPLNQPEAVRLVGLRENRRVRRALSDDVHVAGSHTAGQVDGQRTRRIAVEAHLDVVAGERNAAGTCRCRSRAPCCCSSPRCTRRRTTPSARPAPHLVPPTPASTPSAHVKEHNDRTTSTSPDLSPGIETWLPGRVRRDSRAYVRKRQGRIRLLPHSQAYFETSRRRRRCEQNDKACPLRLQSFAALGTSATSPATPLSRAGARTVDAPRPSSPRSRSLACTH